MTIVLDLAPCLWGKRAGSIGYVCDGKGFAVLISVVGSCRVQDPAVMPCRVPGGERAVVHLVVTALAIMIVPKTTEVPVRFLRKQQRRAALIR